jgi:hypothetical protein
VTWAVEFEDAYDAWDVTTDIEDDVDIRLGVLEYMRSWRLSGPPADAGFNANRDTLSCPIPGTPIVVEFLATEYSDPPTVVVRRFS